jgi:hypothetical protein
VLSESGALFGIAIVKLLKPSICIDLDQKSEVPLLASKQAILRCGRGYAVQLAPLASKQMAAVHDIIWWTQ